MAIRQNEILYHFSLNFQISPDGIPAQQVNKFTTGILQTTMDHLIASDVLLYGSASSLPLTVGQSTDYSTLAANVFYLTSRVTDCLWNGTFLGSSQDVFDFLVKLLSQAKRKGGIPLDALYTSMNRTILYLLSRPIENVGGRVLYSILYKIDFIQVSFSSLSFENRFFFF